MFNVRRGSGIEDDLMVADLMITDQTAIKAVQDDGIEEVSLGYEADYEQVSPGRGVQRNIVVNHVALVERGRCGPRCAIGDKAMTQKVKRSFADRIRAAWMSKDADEAEKLAKEAEDADMEEKGGDEKDDKAKTGDALKQVLDRLTAMDADIQELKKAAAEDGDEDGDGKKTDDETTDAAKAAALCKCQRKALDVAYQTDAGRSAIEPFLSGRTADFDKLPAALVHAAFMGASELMRAKNNDGNSRVSMSTRDFGKPTSVTDINARNKQFWADRSKH
jgi:hypothetical protein